MVVKSLTAQLKKEDPFPFHILNSSSAILDQRWITLLRVARPRYLLSLDGLLTVSRR